MKLFRRSTSLVSLALVAALFVNLLPEPLGVALAGYAGPPLSRAIGALGSAELPRPDGTSLTYQFTPLGAPATAQISPDNGGVLQTADGRITLTFPSGATSEAVDVSIAPLEPAAWGAPGMRMVDLFELKALTSIKKEKVSQFLKDVQMSLKFSADYNVKELAGLDINTLGLYYLNESTGQWEQVTAAREQKVGPELKAATRHFSIFGSQAMPIISGPGQVLGFESDLHTGAATTSIPIEVPPGPGGFEPKIDLTYSSGSVDEMKNKRDVGSWVGIGWDLKLPSISYNPEKSKYYLNLNGSYELRAYGGYYHTVPESYLTLKKTTTWEVWDRDGAYYLMDAIRSYTDGNGTAWTATTNYRWDTTLIRDVHGNETAITYDVDRVTVYYTKDDIVSAYPLDITYGKNGSNSNSRFNIHFNNGSDGTRNSTWGWIRADNPGPSTYARVRENKRLNSIEVGTAPEEIARAILDDVASRPELQGPNLC